MSVTTSICRKCDIKLDECNWSPSYRKNRNYICKGCAREESRQWRKANPEKGREITRLWVKANPERVKEIAIRGKRKRGVRPFNENKECASFLGVHVAERVLSKVFNNVERMPIHNPEYDFVCGKGYKIDVKCSCLNGLTYPCWKFNIVRNTIADYFLCLAFDNRDDLNPLHLWLIPGKKINHLHGLSIAWNKVHKWNKCKLPIEKVINCCEAMR